MIRIIFLLLLSLVCVSANAKQYTETGIASYYHDMFHGRTTANGEVFDQRKMTAAHKSLPFNAIVKVTRLDNGNSIIVRVNDRGPYVSGRIIDLSKRAGEELGIMGSGTTKVKIEVLNTKNFPNLSKRASEMQDEMSTKTEESKSKSESSAKVKLPKTAIGNYEFNGTDDIILIDILGFDESFIKFRYVNQNVKTNCKIDIESEAIRIDKDLDHAAVYELEDGKKVKIIDYLYKLNECELIIGISKDYTKAIIRKNSCNDTNDDCEYNFNSWLDRKRLEITE